MLVLRSWWADHRTGVIRLAIVLMTLAAVLRLGTEFWRLLWEPGRTGAIDLIILHEQVHHWFAGRPVYSDYGELIRLRYPPASYVILWPFLGWLAVTPARWLWAVTTVAALGWLVYLTVQESGATARLERVFMALLPLSMYATNATIGNGQLIVHFLPMLVAGLSLLQRGQQGWRENLLAAVLVLMALVKPTISAPFFWIVLCVPDTLRPAVLVSLGYVALTLFAALFQESSSLLLLHDWSGRAVEGASLYSMRGGYANLHTWLGALGLQEWNLPASLLMLVALGFWTYRHRHADLWLLLGIAALVARFWTYHRLYDDLLILLPAVALFRIAKRGPSADDGDVLAGVLLATTWVAMLAPARLLVFPPPWSWLFEAGQTIVWVAVLIFLLNQTSREQYARIG